MHSLLSMPLSVKLSPIHTKNFTYSCQNKKCRLRIYNSSPNSAIKQIIKIITKYIDTEITSFSNNAFQNTLQPLQKLCVKSGGEKKSMIQNICFNLVTSCAFFFNSISLVWLYLHFFPFLRCWPPAPHVLQRSPVHIIVTGILIFVPYSLSCFAIFNRASFAPQRQMNLTSCTFIAFPLVFDTTSTLPPCIFPCHCIIFFPSEKASKDAIWLHHLTTLSYTLLV